MQHASSGELQMTTGICHLRANRVLTIIQELALSPENRLTIGDRCDQFMLSLTSLGLIVLRMFSRMAGSLQNPCRRVLYLLHQTSTPYSVKRAG